MNEHNLLTVVMPVADIIILTQTPLCGQTNMTDTTNVCRTFRNTTVSTSRTERTNLLSEDATNICLSCLVRVTEFEPLQLVFMPWWFSSCYCEAAACVTMCVCVSVALCYTDTLCSMSLLRLLETVYWLKVNPCHELSLLHTVLSLMLSFMLQCVAISCIA